MRNAFVVLVSLCIGLVSGFIVPPSVSELTSKISSSNTETSRSVEVKSTTFPTKYAVLPKSRNEIDEKDLYEHATEKKNNQSERAFIYINQKYKKPVRNKLIKVLPIDQIDLARLATPPVPLTGVAQTPCPSAFDSGPNSNSYFQGFDFSDKQPQDMASYFAAPNIFRCNFNGESKKTKENAKIKMQMQITNRADERRDYFELLKPPILRPVNRLNSKGSYGSIHQNKFPSLSPPNIPHRENNYLKKYNLKNQYLSQAKAAIVRQDEIRKNYKFDGSFIRRPTFQTKELVNRVDDVNFESDFINEDDSRRIYENNQEEDRLLDKYLKDTLEEQISINDKVSANKPDCSYRDCILQTSKLYKNNGLLIKPDCRCEKWLNIKHIDSFLAKDRSLREETKRNETVPKSSESNYYEEMLTDDSNMNRQDDDIIRPPKKFNVTLGH